MSQIVDLAGNDLKVNQLYVGATTPGAAGTLMSGSEIVVLDGVTAGTAAASKAVVLDSGLKVAGIAQETFAAGTATVAPIVLTAGTNLTTAAAGALEFDGAAFYTTSRASSRQQVDAEQFIFQTADNTPDSNTLLDTNAAAAVFRTANGAVTLVAGKTYVFEGVYNLTNTGTTSHTWAALFGGTASFTAAGTIWQGWGNSSGTANAAATGGLSGFSALPGTALVLTAASTSATEQVSINVTGTLVINAGGTLIPQMKASARPGASGTPGVVVKAGSFFRIWEMGTLGAVGNWS